MAAFDVPFLSMLPSILIYPAEYWEAFNIEIKGNMGMKWFDNLRNHLQISLLILSKFKGS